MAFIIPALPTVRKRSRHSGGVQQGPCSVRASADGGRVTRRDFARLSALVATAVAAGAAPRPAAAMSGLKVFPLTEQLGNDYFLMRAGESVAEARGEARSHPLDMINVHTRGLTKRGIEQTRRAAAALRARGVEFDAWLWAAIATNSMETAEVLAYELGIRRERVVPEFSFLDARGLGILDGMPERDVMARLRALDALDTNAKPEPNTDGTPNESVEQVFVKVRQLLSKLETQYFGENIVVIAPDSQPLSIMQSALVDRDLAAHHELAFVPGEIRHVVGKVYSALDGSETQKARVEILHA